MPGYVNLGNVYFTYTKIDLSSLSSLSLERFCSFPTVSQKKSSLELPGVHLREKQTSPSWIRIVAWPLLRAQVPTLFTGRGESVPVHVAGTAACGDQQHAHCFFFVGSLCTGLGSPPQLGELRPHWMQLPQFQSRRTRREETTHRPTDQPTDQPTDRLQRVQRRKV